MVLFDEYIFIVMPNLSSFPINFKTNKHYSKILFGKASLQNL
jgi:hypothetical protein